MENKKQQAGEKKIRGKNIALRIGTPFCPVEKTIP
jgi:hypothetical protein